jgi:hypothetical protein
VHYIIKGVLSMSIGGGKSDSKSKSGGSSTQESFISPDQLPYLKDLWQQSSQGILGGSVGAADIAGGQNLMQGITNNPFMQGLQDFAKPNNAMAQQNIDVLGQNLNQNLARNLMPQISDQAQQSGGFGGGRQGVAQGLALQGTQQAFAQGSQDILNNTYNQAQQANQFGANWATQNALGGIGALGQLQQQQFAPYLTLAQILGNPAILGRSNSSQSGMSSGSSSQASIGFA